MRSLLVRLGLHRSASQLSTLLAGAIWSFTTGLSYLPGVTDAELPNGIRIFLDSAPISVRAFAGAWLITCALIVGSVLWKRLTLISTLVFVGMCAFSAVVYTGSWAQDWYYSQPSREWVTAGKYWAGCFVGLAVTPHRRPLPSLPFPPIRIRKEGR